MKWNEINTIAQKHRSPLYHILNRFINSQIESSSGVKKEKRKKNLLSKRKTQSRSVWQINAMVSHRWRVHYQPCRAYSNSLQRNGEKRMAWRVFFVSSFAARRILINRFVPFRFAATRCKGFRPHHLSVAGRGDGEGGISGPIIIDTIHHPRSRLLPISFLRGRRRSGLRNYVPCVSDFIISVGGTCAGRRA